MVKLLMLCFRFVLCLFGLQYVSSENFVVCFELCGNYFERNVYQVPYLCTLLCVVML